MKRRDFIKRLAMAGAAPFALGRLSGLAHARPFLNIKSTNGKVLIVIQLKGGNDGLNTIIPYRNDVYYANRPALAIPQSAVVRLTDDLGLHPKMAAFKELYDNGEFTVVHNVGYENQNRSHFRSTDIWLSGSDADEYVFDGWAGRSLARLFPDYPGEIPEHPMAVQLGSVQSLMLQGPDGGMGLTIEDPNTFYQLVSGSTADNDPPPDTVAGHELAFLKQVAAQSIQYADVLKETADKGENTVEYPDDKLATQMSIIARLIAGGLQTPVYMAQLSGFDTHSDQAGRHEKLLQELTAAVSAFQKDIDNLGLGRDVLILTISEFGRRLAENGSAGTDHGAAAPMMLIGQPGAGGFFGDAPDLTDLDKKGDVKYKIDFRRVYASLLQDHLGMSQEEVNQALMQNFATLPIVDNPQTGVETGGGPDSYFLGQNYPNPFNNATRIDYALPTRSHVRLELFNSLGRRVQSLVNETQSAGRYSVGFNAAELPSGVYFYQLTADHFTQKRRMMLVR